MKRFVFRLLVILVIAGTAGCAPRLGRVDPKQFPDPPKNAITFWGHACCYIDVDGFGIVTDPVFEMWASMRRRKVHIPPPSAYRDTRVILLSHSHSDHLSWKTLSLFPARAVILCPEPCLDHLEGLDQEIRVMKPGDEHKIPAGRIIAVAASHPGGRYAISGDDEAGALGYVIDTDSAVIYYSGDTDYFPGFEEVGLKYRPDIALLNINSHLHALDAVRATWALRSQTMIPLHYGAYGYLFVREFRQPRNYEEMKKLLGPILTPVKLGESFTIR
jgi:L-ascorbate metabolism protein UlaG (beta-lactamase superfamily)